MARVTQRQVYAVAAFGLMYFVMLILGMDPITARRCKAVVKKTEGRSLSAAEAQEVTQCVTGTTGAPFLLAVAGIAAAAYALGK